MSPLTPATRPNSPLARFSHFWSPTFLAIARTLFQSSAAAAVFVLRSMLPKSASPREVSRLRLERSHKSPPQGRDEVGPVWHIVHCERHRSGDIRPPLWRIT